MQPVDSNSDAEKPDADSPSVWMKQQDQTTLFGVAVCVLVLMASYSLYRGGHRGRLIEVDRAAPLTATYVVDINRADWPEMVQLPGLGETLARRIVAHRQQNGPFANIEQLDRVNGIGRRTLERLRPYLLPIPDETDFAGLQTGAPGT